MPLYPHDNFGDVVKHLFYKGTITAVDSDDDTADVTVPGGQDGTAVPLFYHCDPESEERSNGAIKDAAQAFSKNDEVIVMCDTYKKPVRVVGFVDGIKPCGTIYLIIIAYAPTPGFPTMTSKYATIWDVENEEFVAKIGNVELPCVYEENDSSVLYRWIQDGKNQPLQDAVHYIDPRTIPDEGYQEAGPAPGFFGADYRLVNTVQASGIYNYDFAVNWSYNESFKPGGQWEVPLWSFGITRLGETAFATDHPCIRTRMVGTTPGEYWTSDDDNFSNKLIDFYCYTPIGDMEPFQIIWYSGVYSTTAGWSREQRVFTINIPAWGSLIHWCDVALLHIYYIAPLVRDEYNGRGVYDKITWERKEPQVVAGVHHFPGEDAKEADPFDVVRSPGLEAAIKTLIDKALNPGLLQPFPEDENLYYLTTKVIRGQDPSTFE